MRKIHLAVGSLALAAALFGTSNASAQKQSQHGPGYVAGNVLGFSIISVGGTTTVTGALTRTTLRRGESVLVTADEQVLTFAGDGDLYLAASELRG